MLAPQNNWEVSDYALSFPFQRQSFHEDEEASPWSIGKYHIQISKTDKFLDPYLNVYHLAPGLDVSRVEEGDETDEEFLELSEELRHWTEAVYSPKETLEIGDWYWRVRAADKPDRNWSEAIKFKIKKPGRNQKTARPLSPQNPLFTFDMYDSDSGGWGDEPPWEK